jgi:CheY-like chemotaxis protein
VSFPLFYTQFKSAIFNQKNKEAKMKILQIVEDNPQMRQMIKSLYAGYFYKVFECEDGSQALEVYRRNKPDWVLMDIVMKQMDGITATKQITSTFPDAKIIIVTDYDDKELRIRAKSAGALYYVLKEDLSVLEKIFINNISNQIN